MQFVHTGFFCSLLLINPLESFVFTLCMINKVSVYGAISVRGTAARNPTYSPGETRPPSTEPHQVRFCLGGCPFRSGENIACHEYYGIDESHLGFVRSSATAIWAAGPPTSVFDFPERLVFILYLPILKSYVHPPPTSLVQICWEETVRSQGSTLHVFIQLSIWGNPSVSSVSCMTEHVLWQTSFRGSLGQG